MGKHEHPVPALPAMSGAAVVGRLAECRRRLALQQDERPALALASALREPGAAERLAVLGQQIAAMQFEIDCNIVAGAHASMLDSTALAVWRAKLQEMPSEELIAGLSQDGCCGLCGPEAGCVLTGADPMSGGACAHPVREGGPHPQYRNHPRIQAVYRAACEKLKIQPKGGPRA